MNCCFALKQTHILSYNPKYLLRGFAIPKGLHGAGCTYREPFAFSRKEYGDNPKSIVIGGFVVHYCATDQANEWSWFTNKDNPIIIEAPKEFLRLGVKGMNLARVSANGQITVPVEIRRLLKLKTGDKVLFLPKENGEVVVGNAASLALSEAQKAFAGVAQELGNPTEDDIQSWVDEVRYNAEDAI